MKSQETVSNIREIVQNVGRLTDMKQWDRLEHLFVQTPKIDTQKFDGEPATKTNRRNFIADLRAEMRKYFAGTRHKMKTFNVEVKAKEL